jgi:hypothetical protein
MLYEILKFSHLNSLDEKVLAMFRVDVKKRLYLMSRDSENERGEKLKNKTKPFPYLEVDGKVIKR